MKIRNIALILVFLAALLFFLFLISETNRDDRLSESTVVVPEENVDDSQRNQEVPKAEQIPSSQPSSSQVESYLGAFNTPISFYGKAIDTEGEPVAKAQIFFGALNKPLTPSDPATRYTTVSDNSGLFSITGIKGSRLVVRVEKDGYRTLPSEFEGIYYSNPTPKTRIPTKDNPAVFVLEKLNDSVDLFKERITEKLSLEGNPVSVPIFNGTETLTISLISDYNRQTYAYSKWQAAIKLSNGGFLQTEETYNFEAPVEGYDSELEYRVTDESERKAKKIDRSFYFILNNGEYYGRMNLLVSAAGGFRLEYFVNPSGGRNLNP